MISIVIVVVVVVFVLVVVLVVVVVIVVVVVVDFDGTLKDHFFIQGLKNIFCFFGLIGSRIFRPRVVEP